MDRTPKPPRRARSTLPVALAAVVVLLVGIGAIAVTMGDGRVSGQATPAAGAATDTSRAWASTTSPGTGTDKRTSPPPSRQESDDVTCTQAEAIAAMPLRDRLAQLLMVGVGAASAAEALSVVRSEHVGALFLTGEASGLLTGGGLRRVQQASPIPLIIAVDDEGGRVQRIVGLAGPMPSAREMAATMTPHQVYELALRRGKILAAHGVTMNLAPVLDVSSRPDGAVIGDRSFSADPEVVARYAGAFARGMRAAGIMPVFKHFPGHGRATGDTHLGAATTPPLSELMGHDLLPYRKLLDGGGNTGVMLGHLYVPGLTEPGVPASLSSAAVRLLREEFGFDGLIMTDDLYAMDAIRDYYGLAEAVRMALAAGVDMALMVSAEKLHTVLDKLETAVANGTLSERRVNEAVAHVLRAKNVNLCA